MSKKDNGLKALTDLIQESFYNPVEESVDKVNKELEKKSQSLEKKVRRLDSRVKALTEKTNELGNNTIKAFNNTSENVDEQLRQLEKSQKKHFTGQEERLVQQEKALVEHNESLSEQRKMLEDQRNHVDEQGVILEQHTNKLDTTAQRLGSLEESLNDIRTEVKQQKQELQDRLNTHHQLAVEKATTLHNGLEEVGSELKSQLAKYANEQLNSIQEQETALIRKVDTEIEKSIKQVKDTASTIKTQKKELSTLIEEEGKKQRQYVMFSVAIGVLLIMIAFVTGLYIA